MKYLALTVISKPQAKLVYELAKFIKHAGCNVMEVKWSNPGTESVGYYLISGNWNSIAKLESTVAHFERKHEMSLLVRRVDIREAQLDRLPYTIYLTSQDHPGVLEEVMGFLASEDIEVIHITGNTFLARYTSVPMVTMTIEMTIPTSYLISDFRERFILFCDELNLDVTVEPDKT